MIKTIAFTVAALIAVTAVPALAADAMKAGGMMAGANYSMMMKPGEAMMVMPNGETMMLPAMKGKMDAGMEAAAKPMDKCMIMMMGTDGKMHMVEDMKMADGKMACEAMSMMKH